MLGNLPDILVDLLEVASYVYCADQRLKRVTNTLPGYAENWHRHLVFKIPVKCLEQWQRPEVIAGLKSTLGFLSDDSYEFEFSQSNADNQAKELYFHDFIDASLENDEVVLFSVGIDSFAGVVSDLVDAGMSLTLVSHGSATKVQAVQSRLVDAIKKDRFSRKVSHIPVLVGHKEQTPAEFTQRSRSFLFACLGLAVARMSGKSRFTFYENGVVSINLPLAGDVTGGRATRTTHPLVVRGMEDLFSSLLDTQIEIRTPFQWLTKAEVTKIIERSGFANLLGQTVSCTRPRGWSGTKWHCGVCSQCIDRRFGVLAAGMGEFDPADGYKHDLFLSPRSESNDGVDGRMALAYVNLFKKVAGTSKERFLVDFSEVATALGHFRELTCAQAGEKLYDLFQRHAHAVEEVIAAEMQRYNGQLFRDELNQTCLLASCYSRKIVEVAPPTNYDIEAKAMIDRLAAPIVEFAVDSKHNLIRFRGGVSLSGKEYDFVMALVPNFRKAKAEASDVGFVAAADLAHNLDITDQSVRQHVTRVRDSLEALTVAMGIPMTNDTFIENKPRQGYRINPKCKESALGDLAE